MFQIGYLLTRYQYDKGYYDNGDQQVCIQLQGKLGNPVKINWLKTCYSQTLLNDAKEQAQVYK